MVIYRFVNGQDRVKQCPVSCGSVQSSHGGRQRFDEVLVLQLGYVLPHRVGTHAGALSDFPKARVANVCLPVLTKQQVRVNSDLPGAQSQNKDLIGQKKKSSLPWFSLASPSHIFSASPLLVFQNSFCEAFSLFYAAQLLRGSWPLFSGKQKAGIAPGPCIKIRFSTTFWSNRIRMLAANFSHPRKGGRDGIS